MQVATHRCWPLSQKSLVCSCILYYKPMIFWQILSLFCPQFRAIFSARQGPTLMGVVVWEVRTGERESHVLRGPWNFLWLVGVASIMTLIVFFQNMTSWLAMKRPNLQARSSTKEYFFLRGIYWSALCWSLHILPFYSSCLNSTKKCKLQNSRFTKPTKFAAVPKQLIQQLHTAPISSFHDSTPNVFSHGHQAWSKSSALNSTLIFLHWGHSPPESRKYVLRWSQDWGKKHVVYIMCMYIQYIYIYIYIRCLVQIWSLYIPTILSRSQPAVEKLELSGPTFGLFQPTHDATPWRTVGCQPQVMLEKVG